MRLIRKYLVLMIVSLSVITACKDESLVLLPEWESAVHGLGEITSDDTDFNYNDPSVNVDIDLKWISIDGKLTVTKIEVFALYDESYVDVDGNPAIASHGGTEGRLIQSYDGGAVPANRAPVSFTVNQTSIYELYKDATFDYGNGEVPVFTNPGNPYRTDTKRFMWDDHITVRWEYTTEDGRIFKKWAPSVCTEFPGANCEVAVGVVCASEISAPAGDWVFDMQDTYGDGWQGGYIGVVIDGVEAHQLKVPEGNGNTSLQTIINVPVSATTLKFVWHDDDFDEECVFKITSPKGNVVANVATPSAGPIKLNLCLE